MEVEITESTIKSMEHLMGGTREKIMHHSKTFSLEEMGEGKELLEGGETISLMRLFHYFPTAETASRGIASIILTPFTSLTYHSAFYLMNLPITHL